MWDILIQIQRRIQITTFMNQGLGVALYLSFGRAQGSRVDGRSLRARTRVRDNLASARGWLYNDLTQLK